MGTQQIELYIEKIRSGIEVTGMVGNEYVEMRYKSFLNSHADLEGHFNLMGITPSIIRTYGELCNRRIESNDGYWKNGGRKKITDEMFTIIGEVENYLSENGYQIIE
jgi:hypothetical protein